MRSTGKFNLKEKIIVRVEECGCEFRGGVWTKTCATHWDINKLK